VKFRQLFYDVLQQFVSERKQYEDLSLQQRFTCDVGQIFDNITQFGEGLYAHML